MDVRAAGLGLGSTLTVIVPLPTPVAEGSVTHAALGEADQAHPAVVVTTTGNVAPSLVALTKDGDTPKLHATAAWVTLTVLPATVTVPVRGEVAALAATASVTAPLAAPEVADGTIHETLEAAAQVQPSVLVTATVVLDAALDSDAVTGDTSKEHGAAACVKVAARPPTVNVAERDSVAALADAVTVSIALPEPLDGSVVSHVAPEAAVQAQPLPVVSATWVEPPAWASEADVGESEKVHSAAAWSTLTALPARVTVPVRVAVAVLAAMDSVTVLVLEPLVRDSVIQATSDAAVQLHPDAVVTVTLEVPAALDADTLAGDTE